MRTLISIHPLNQIHADSFCHVALPSSSFPLLQFDYEYDPASARVPLEIVIEILSKVNLIQDLTSSARVSKIWSNASLLARKDLTILRIRPSLIRFSNYLQSLSKSIKKKNHKILTEISISTLSIGLKDVEILEKIIEISKEELKVFRIKAKKVEDRKIPLMLLNIAIQCPKLKTLLLDIKDVPEKENFSFQNIHGARSSILGGGIDLQIRVVQPLAKFSPVARIESLTLNTDLPLLAPDSLEKEEFKTWISEVKYLHLGRDGYLLQVSRISSILEACKETLQVFSLMSQYCTEFFFDGVPPAQQDGPSNQSANTISVGDLLQQQGQPAAQQAAGVEPPQVGPQLAFQVAQQPAPQLDAEDTETEPKIIHSWEEAATMNRSAQLVQLALALPVIELPCLRSLNFRHEASSFLARIKAPHLQNLAFGAGYKPTILGAPFGNLNASTLTNVKSLQVCANLIKKGGIHEEQLCTQLTKWESLEKLSLLNREGEVDFGLGDKDEDDGEIIQAIPDWAQARTFKSVNDGIYFTKYVIQRLTPHSALNDTIATEGGDLLGRKISGISIAIKDEETATLLIRLLAARIAFARNLSPAKVKEAANEPKLLQPWCGLIQPSRNPSGDIFPEISVIETITVDLSESDDWETQKLRGELPIEVTKLLGNRELWSFERTWSIPQLNEGSTNFRKDWQQMEREEEEGNDEEETMSERIRRLEKEAEEASSESDWNESDFYVSDDDEPELEDDDED